MSTPRRPPPDRAADDEETLARIAALHRDVDLPVLDRLRTDLQTRMQTDGPPAAAPAAPRRSRSPRALHAPARIRQPRRRQRIARRSAISAVLLFLLGATAIAATSLVDSGPPATTEPTTLAGGGSGLAHHTLSAYGRSGTLCLAVRTGANLASACTPPPTTDSVRVLSAHGAFRRFVVGLAGSDVAHVRIQIDNTTRTVETSPLPTAPDLPAGVRWFQAAFPAARNAALEPPATVTPLDNARKALRSAVLDCTLGTVPTASPTTPTPTGRIDRVCADP